MYIHACMHIHIHVSFSSFARHCIDIYDSYIRTYMFNILYSICLIVCVYTFGLNFCMPVCIQYVHFFSCCALQSSSATSLSSARERRRKHKQEKQQNARRSFSGPKMVLKSRSSNDVKSDRTPPTPEGKESVCESKPSDCKGGLILKPEQDTHTPEETDGPQSPEGRLQPGSDWSKHVQSGLQQMKDNVQQPPVDKPGGKSVGDNLLQRDNSTEPSLHIGGHHSQGNSPLVGDRKTKAEATSLQRGHSSEPDLCSKENAVVTDAHRDYTLLRPPSGVCEDNLYQSEGSTDSLDRLVAGKKQVAEGIGEKRSEEFDSMLTIMDETLHLPPSEERRELTPTPPKVAFVTGTHVHTYVCVYILANLLHRSLD